MADQDKTPQADQSPDAKADNVAEEQTNENGGRSVFFKMAVGFAIFIGVLVVVLLVAIIVGLLFGEHESVADWVSIFRDLFIILLAMEGIVMGTAMIVLVIQLAALINLLQNEVQPIVDNANETVSTVRGTAQFMSQNLVEPVVKMSALAAGIGGVLREVVGIRKALNQAGKNGDKPDETITTPDS